MRALIFLRIVFFLHDAFMEMSKATEPTKRNTQKPAGSNSSNGEQVSTQEFIVDDQRAEHATQLKLKAMADRGPQKTIPIQKKENPNGLPQKLQAGIEGLSGINMADVTVHRNSNKPAQLQAHAYAQGTDIHLGPGQEKHLAHEAWHVVQQKQGRVKPTLQLKSKININDDAGLEKEADIMGDKALQFSSFHSQSLITQRAIDTSLVQRKVVKGLLNVIGENHTESEKRLGDEKKYLKHVTGSSNYWDEVTFKIGEATWGQTLGRDDRKKGDPSILHLEYLMSGLLRNLKSNENKAIADDHLSAKDHSGFHLWPWDSYLAMKSDVAGLIQMAYYDLTKDEVTSFNDGTLDTLTKDADKAMKALTEMYKSGDHTKVVATYGTLVKNVSAINTILFGQLRQPAVVNDDRETNMHGAANRDHAKKGAWKIGNHHTKSIAKKIADKTLDAAEYNLVQEGEFDAELKQAKKDGTI